MQGFIDLVVAAFISVLFASLYRKRNTAHIRLWMVGWCFILLHFALLLLNPASVAGQTLQTIGALVSLVLCAIAFVLSRQEGRTSRRRTMLLFALLGVPWIAALPMAALPQPWFWPAAVFVLLGAAAMILAATRLCGMLTLRMLFVLLIATGCTVWLAFAISAHSADALVCNVLTQCFGLNAVLLSPLGTRRLSAATVTTSVGAITWGLVWVAASTLEHFAPHRFVGSEIWNLPKYFLAAGMILCLLEDEIQSAAIASQQYRMLFASNPHPMWMYDPATLDFLQANQAAVQQYGYTEEEFRSIDLLAIVEAGHDADLLAGLRETGPQQLTGPWKHRRKDGSFFQVDMASQPVLLEGRRVTFALMQDVTERERLHAQLLRQAQHDVLTDLANRDLFEQRFTDFVQRATRSRRRAAIFCFDLDRFKQINDSYGHSAGDACLKEVSLRMHQLVAQRGIVCRSGGDEFLISLSDLASVQEAEQFASELLRSLTNPLQLQGGEFEMGASIGFAIYPDDGTDQALLWRDADAAMYQAKRGGGAHWVRVSHEISSSASEASEIEFALRRALKSGNFEVHYQPLVGLDGSLHSFEALLRSPDPLLRSVPTDRIIAIAEVSGMIVPVGNWVLEEVCRQFRAWMDAGVAPERIAVNVSPLQLMRFDFSRHVAATLERFRLNARVLEFEVTESTVMPDRGFDVPHQIRTLARMGIRFSADDFGTGYSSLGRLHQLPVDELKIDRSFIQRIAEDNGTYPTVQAIIVLAHTFGMKVVAEGVETEEQVSLLRDLKCDLLQGFLFGRPLPSRMTTELLRQRIAA